MSGWIKLHRQIRDHWLWSDSNKLKMWLDIILEVNHAPTKIVMGYTLIECERGQTIRSLQGWAERWNISKDSARHFLMLLQKDNMITMENMKFTTRITVCNYETYNSTAHTEQTESKRRANGEQTQADPNKNNKEGKECKEIGIKQQEFRAEVYSFSDNFTDDILRDFYIYWSEPNQSKTKMRKELERTWDTSRRLYKWKSNKDQWKK